MVKKSCLFLDTIVNKIDTKGRVSIPADYRCILDERQVELVLYRSFIHPCIEGCTAGLLEQMVGDINQTYDTFSQEQDDLTSLIFADSKLFIPDSTGRISLTPKLLTHAQLTDTAVFVGKGKTFQIWHPALFDAHYESLRQRAVQNPPRIMRLTENRP